MYKYYLAYKPFDVLCQFTKEKDDDRTLQELKIADKDVYSVGRLDKDSEGMLLLTNDNKLKNAITHAENKIYKSYYCQVEGLISTKAISQLQNPLTIKINGSNYTTKPAKVRPLENVENLPDRNPPIRHRESIPTSWIEIKICEGKNRQVRKMLATVGFPVLRLIRVGIGNLKLQFPIDFKVKSVGKKELDLIF